jgi:hypothetical protein
MGFDTDDDLDDDDDFALPDLPVPDDDVPDFVLPPPAVPVPEPVNLPLPRPRTPVPDDEQLSPRWAPPRLPTPEPPELPRAIVDFNWEDYIDFSPVVAPTDGLPAQGRGTPRSSQYRPVLDYSLPQVLAPRTATNMQRMWATEGLRAKFHKVPKPRLLRESHFRPDDPLYQPTKETLLAQVAAGKYTECSQPPLVCMPWFGVPKPDGTVRPIHDCRYVNKYMKAPKISLPGMPKLMKGVPSRYKWALHYDISSGFDHIPRHADSQTYFGLQIDGKYYVSTRIAMGETCAPWAFQVWLHDMFKSFLRESALTFVPIKKQHIDDLLFLFTSSAQARAFRDKWHSWAADHGLLLNLRKSTTEPTQVVKHIGFELDLRTKQCRLTKTRQKEVVELLQQFQSYTGPLPTLVWQKFVGLLGWARCASPYVLGLLSPAIDLINHPRLHVASTVVNYTELLSFFVANDPICWSTSSKPTAVIVTDATFARAGLISAAGCASVPVPVQYRSTIFLAELWAACSALLTHTRKNDCVRLWIDNQPAMYALRKGRTKASDPAAQSLLTKVHRHLYKLRATVLPTYVHTSCNPADELSRLRLPSRRLLRFAWRHRDCSFPDVMTGFGRLCSTDSIGLSGHKPIKEMPQLWLRSQHF